MHLFQGSRNNVKMTAAGTGHFALRTRCFVLFAVSWLGHFRGCNGKIWTYVHAAANWFVYNYPRFFVLFVAQTRQVLLLFLLPSLHGWSIWLMKKKYCFQIADNQVRDKHKFTTFESGKICIWFRQSTSATNQQMQSTVSKLDVEPEQWNVNRSGSFTEASLFSFRVCCDWTSQLGH